MELFAFLVFLIGLALVCALAAQRNRGLQKQLDLGAAIRAAAAIATIRLAVYWVGLALLTGYADVRQAFGYVLLILNSFVELGIASIWNGYRPGSTLMVSCLIVLTSAGLGCVWAWIHSPPITSRQGIDIR